MLTATHAGVSEKIGAQFRQRNHRFNMAEAMSTIVLSSELCNQNKCDLSVSECSNCVLLDSQLHTALHELESAKLILKLLQKESDRFTSW